MKYQIRSSDSLNTELQEARLGITCDAKARTVSLRAWSDHSLGCKVEVQLSDEEVAQLVSALKSAGWFNKPHLSQEERLQALATPSELEDNHS